MTALLQLNYLLRAAGYDPAAVIVLRHRPWESKLRRVFLWIAAERADLYDAFQSTHAIAVEKALTRAKYVASFVGHQAGLALFISFHRIEGWAEISYQEYWAISEHRELRALGMAGMRPERGSILRFRLAASDFCSDWKGRLVCEWTGGERSWWRWADRNTLPVHAINEESLLIRPIPDWHSLSLSWQELKTLPAHWKAALAQWRGIYFIYDKAVRMGYVGSAYGADNLMGRWLGYAASGHGGNKLLRAREPDDFVFSILQRVSPDLDAGDVIAIENSWKERLQTRSPFGLNEN